MTNLRKILALSGAALGATYALLSGGDVVSGLSYTVAGSGVAPLSIAFGKLLIRGVSDLFDKKPPEGTEMVKQDIATIFSVGICDLACTHGYDLLNTPNTLMFRSLFVAGAGNLAPLVKDVFDQAYIPEVERNRMR
ncbi:MAG: hypothetical protein AB7V32_06220 [Candidatus Berkiella sp.]